MKLIALVTAHYRFVSAASQNIGGENKELRHSKERTVFACAPMLAPAPIMASNEALLVPSVTITPTPVAP